MIDLTPLEVRKKKGDFRKAMRGYEPQAVDDFLDLVADRLEQLVRENAALQERASSITSQVSDYRERERALTEALVTAQEMREQMRVQVEREVELKLREAEADVEAMRSGAAQQREREEENIRRLRARQSQFVQSYRGFLERELAELSVMAQTLDLSSQDDVPAPPPRKRGRKAEPAPEPQAFTPPPVTRTPEPIAAAPLRKPEPEPEPAFEPEPPFAPEPSFGPETPFEPEAFEPMPMPLPQAEIESEPAAFEGFDTFDDSQHELIDLSMHFPEPPPEPVAEPAPVAPPAARAPAPPVQPAPPAAPQPVKPAAPAAPAASIGPQIDFGEPPIREDLPEELPELELLEPIDERVEKKNKDEDADGWVSSLLEGKGD